MPTPPSTEKTHFRKAFHSPYLGSVDIVDPITVTIDRVLLLPDATKKTKDQFNTAHFREKFLRPGEPMKPMILNVGNCKMLSAMMGSKFIEDWSGACVEIYVETDVKLGRDLVEGLRLRPGQAAQDTPPELMRAAQEHADLGAAGFAAWFNSITPAQRKAIGKANRDQLMERAKQVVVTAQSEGEEQTEDQP